jgi:hypothetical protein
MSDEERTTEETPFIERPDEHDPGDELYCWMPGSEDRECNGSCVAFEERSLQDGRMDMCKALNAIRSLAMSLGIQTKRARGEAIKAEIAKIPEPPEVTS